MIEIHCNLCDGKFMLDKEPKNFSCICQNKPKTMKFTVLLKCQNGHRSWTHSRMADCQECVKEKTINTAKRLLAMNHNPKHESIEQEIVKTNRIINNKTQDYFKKKILADSSIIEIPDLLKNLIETVNSMRKDNENREKLDILGVKLKELEGRIA